MAVNTIPLFSGTPDIKAVRLTAANTKSDGSGTIATDIFKAYTADATYGSYVSSIRLSPYASVAATATTATVIRIYISTVASGSTTAADTWLIQEVAVPIQTASHSTAATYFMELPINRALPAGYTILVSIHAAPATNTGWQAVVFAGRYVAQ